jgi:L-seryl-tRNA(Ser) seleniumtransferase
MTAKRQQAALRAIPSVDRVLRELGQVALPRPVVVAVVRRELEALRLSESPAPDGALDRIRQALDDLKRTQIRPVINGAGIIIHTNFGRSPLAPQAIAALVAIGTNYNNIEYDLAAGARGGRASYLEHNLAVLCESEAATVVNNCAAALVLILRHFTATDPAKAVIISRGELVQIGGGFRIPEILQASGATLREIGATNKTTIDDYRNAIDDRAAMILRVHRSNFFMDGFVDSPSTTQLAEVSRLRQIPLIVDLGSGAMFDTSALGGGEREPTPAQALHDGADLVCFSGDKLLGGPQAGIIAGQADHIRALKNEPFFRALRCDKLILSALAATVDLHLSGKAAELPTIAMMNATVENLRERAGRILAQLRDLPAQIDIGRGEAQVGGGSLPRTIIPSVTLDLHKETMTPEALADRLRRHDPPVIGYVSDDRVKLDLRTIFPAQDSALIAAIRAAIAQS